MNEELDRRRGTRSALQRKVEELNIRLQHTNIDYAATDNEMNAIFVARGSRDLEAHRQVTLVCNEVLESCATLHQVHGQFRSAAQQLDLDADLLAQSIPAAQRLIEFARVYGTRG